MQSVLSPQSARRLPPIQPLERRTLLSSVFIVNSVANSGAGSLRAAITNANTSAAASIITFDLPSGVQTIEPLSALPTITVQIDIRGTTDSAGDPLIELDGADAGSGAVGLNLDRDTTGNTNFSQISGLIINRFSGAGIDLQGDGPAEVFGCRIGTDSTGKKARPNGAGGILIASSNNQIGLAFPGPANQNVISGNDMDGISIAPGGDTSASDNVVQNCLIGTDVTGTKALANGADGIGNLGGFCTIGGSRADQGNLISGNRASGLFGSGSFTTIAGNKIGTNLAGTSAIPNGAEGIDLFDSEQDTIGDQSASGPNLISGNGSDGIDLSVCENVTIINDLIGTDVTGAKALANRGNGVLVGDSVNDSVEFDVISGNTANGIDVAHSSANTSGNEIFECEIGTDKAGVLAIPNGGDGVVMDNAFANAVVGNAIANNGQNGVQVEGGTSVGDTISENKIFANTGLGIDLGVSETPLAAASETSDTPNDQQNYPVLSSAIVSGGKTTVTGTLTSYPSTSFQIELFSTASKDTTGSGQAEAFLGNFLVTTDGSGVAPIDQVVNSAVGFGQFVTATATDDNALGGGTDGDTSEFSQDIGVRGAAISGSVFDDTNANGKQNAGEKGLLKQVVYVDLNGNGKLDPGEPSATTNSNGNYRIFGIAPGTVHVRLEVPSGWRQTDPSSKKPFYKLTVPALSNVGGIVFGEVETATPRPHRREQHRSTRAR